MGVLRARVGGSWVDVAGAPSFLSSPGYVAYAVAGGSQNNITAETDLTGVSVSFTADPARRYKTTLYCVGRQGVTGGEQYVYLCDGSNTKGKASAFDVPANGIATHVVELIETGLSGTTVRKGRVQASAGSWGSAATPWIASISVEDITTAMPVGLATPWIAPTLLNGWANLGAPWQVAQYRKVGDIVYLRGVITNPTPVATNASSGMFTLPTGFRPANYEIASANCAGASGYGAIGRVNMTSAGAVEIVNSGGAAAPHSYTSLSGIQFSVTP